MKCFLSVLAVFSLGLHCYGQFNDPLKQSMFEQTVRRESADAFREEMRKHDFFEGGAADNSSEIAALRSEIEKLRKDLERSNFRVELEPDGRPRYLPSDFYKSKGKIDLMDLRMRKFIKDDPKLRRLFTDADFLAADKALAYKDAWASYLSKRPASEIDAAWNQMFPELKEKPKANTQLSHDQIMEVSRQKAKRSYPAILDEKSALSVKFDEVLERLIAQKSPIVDSPDAPLLITQMAAAEIGLAPVK